MESLFDFIIKKDLSENDIKNVKDVKDVKDILEDKEKIQKIKKKYDYKKYNKTFSETNSEKIKKKCICQVCMGSYTYFNKSKHNKSKRHLLFLNKK
jgi:hypothetical protein